MAGSAKKPLWRLTHTTESGTSHHTARPGFRAALLEEVYRSEIAGSFKAIWFAELKDRSLIERPVLHGGPVEPELDVDLFGLLAAFRRVIHYSLH